MEKRRYDERQRQISLLRSEVEDLKEQIETLDFTVIDYEKVLDVIREGLVVLAKIQNHWQLLTEFFDIIANRVNEAFANGLTDFVAQATASANLGVKKEALDLLATDAAQLYDVAMSLKHVSNVYIEMSRKYVTGELYLITGLPGMSEDQRKAKLVELGRHSTSASTGIQGMADKQRANFEELIDNKTRAIREKYGFPQSEEEGLPNEDYTI